MILIVLIMVRSCSHKNVSIDEKQQVITVASKPLTTTLYFTGIIQPLKTVVITMPADGVIESVMFHYGDVVKKNQPLFAVVSEKFQADYKAALTQYIKAKTDFASNQSQLRESTFLHKNELISDDDYKAKEIGFYNSQLAMVQAKETLSDLIGQLNLQKINIFDLKIEDINKITEALHGQADSQRLQITAPADGVILLANKDDSGDGSLKKNSKGDQLKQGDVLAVIGNTESLDIRISVNEFNINQLKVGQAVHVTGAAFPNLKLTGKIAGLDYQGQPGQNGLPVFPVEIIVPAITAEQQKIIHMGMSAKVAIDIGGEESGIAVPIKAVFQKNGKSFVKVEDQVTGKIREVEVRPGQTTIDSVMIHNLTAGTKIVIAD